MTERWLPAPESNKIDIARWDCGFAEIKPHNSKGIQKGIDALRYVTVTKKGKLRKPGPGRVGRTAKFLVTYLPEEAPGKPAEKDWPSRVRVFATPYDDARTVRPGTGKSIKNTISNWKWEELGCFVPPKVAEVLADERTAGLFGTAIEGHVRELFYRKMLKPKGKEVGGGQTLKGADIFWNELGRFYTELARELGDPFYAELGTELASLRFEGGAPPVDCPGALPPDGKHVKIELCGSS